MFIFKGIKRVKEDVKYDDDEPGDDSKTAVNVEYKSSGTGKRAGPDDMGATAVLEFGIFFTSLLWFFFAPKFFIFLTT